MKTIIYSQKHHPEHAYSGSYANPPYIHSGIAPPRKSNTTKKLQSTISHIKNFRQMHLLAMTNEQQNHMNIQAQSPHINKAKKPTQKPVQNHNQNPIADYFIKEYQKIINNLSTYEQYYQLKLQKQIDLHNNYFKNLIKIIEEQHTKSLENLKNLYKSLVQRTQLQKAVLCHKIVTLENQNTKPYQKQLQELKGQQSLQIPLFQVILTPMDKLREEIKRLTFTTMSAQKLEQEMIQSKILAQALYNEEEALKTEKKDKVPIEEISAEQIEQMNQINSKQEPIQGAKIATNLQDKDLYCDEDIENILKENKVVRKRRYECRQEAIPQESESHQDSGILSRIDILDESCIF